jgi:hypothetical protein
MTPSASPALLQLRMRLWRTPQAHQGTREWHDVARVLAEALAPYRRCTSPHRRPGHLHRGHFRGVPHPRAHRLPRFPCGADQDTRVMCDHWHPDVPPPVVLRNQRARRRREDWSKRAGLGLLAASVGARSAFAGAGLQALGGKSEKDHRSARQASDSRGAQSSDDCNRVVFAGQGARSTR